MPRVIKASLGKMLFVLMLLALLGLWQSEFIITAIFANVFLNSCIIGTFSFGIYAAFSRVVGLRNEFVAFRSLREDYDDAVNGLVLDEKDPMWRYYRCREAAKIFVVPKILERPYTILSEEIATTRKLSVSTSAMQNLLDNVDEQLDEGRSLVAYVTGLLVFLGLIGTFIGLMVTLGSVGEIIGGLDLSGGAGADAIQGLMNDLMIPLKGMATGFSSSLFGLITSLALGLVALFGNQAAGKLKADFGTWLASVATVGSESGPAGGETAGVPGAVLQLDHERLLSVMYRVAKLNLASNSRVLHSVEALSATSKQILEAQAANASNLGALTKAVIQTADAAKSTALSVQEISGNIESRDVLRAIAERLSDDIQHYGQSVATSTLTLERLTEEHSELQRELADFSEQLARQDELATLTSDTQRLITDEAARLHGAVDSVSELMAVIEEGVGHGNGMLEKTKSELDAISGQLAYELQVVIDQTREAIRYAATVSEELQDKAFTEFTLAQRAKADRSQNLPLESLEERRIGKRIANVLRGRR